VKIWARRTEQAEKVAKAARDFGYDVQATDDLENASLQADIISCCTLSQTLLNKGAWVKPGTRTLI
jgi:ornithine cyclodeaminase